ncbi:hypothetical protein [Streptomyces dysideae]|uniref:hypothetical protein n=1 Tax=Streptomyces dysideae TaxID=909626 RepID=UPI00131C8ECC|nr:hypothetical protein [Streptomyces dysideae]
MFFSARKDENYLSRVFLDSRYVPHLHPGGEAAVAVEGVIDIMSAAPGCMGVLYDGAFRGVHRDAIARYGGLIVNKQHKGNEPHFYESLRPGRCIHELWAADGRIAEKVHYADGTAELVPVSIKRLERRGIQTFRWYTFWPFPAATASTSTEPPSGRQAEKANGHPVKVTRNAASIVPSTSSRYRNSPALISSSTPTEATPSRATRNSTPLCGTDASSPTESKPSNS